MYDLICMHIYHGFGRGASGCLLYSFRQHAENKYINHRSIVNWIKKIAYLRKEIFRENEGHLGRE
jgi:hypothetical protein